MSVRELGELGALTLGKCVIFSNNKSTENMSGFSFACLRKDSLIGYKIEDERSRYMFKLYSALNSEFKSSWEKGKKGEMTYTKYTEIKNQRDLNIILKSHIWLEVWDGICC